LVWQSPVYINFIDFKKAFDMIDRSTMWRIMRHYGILLKIVSIIHSLYNGITGQVTTYHPLLLSLLELDRVVCSH